MVWSGRLAGMASTRAMTPACSGQSQLRVAEQRVDGGQAQVAGVDAVVTVGFEVVQERADKLGVEIGQVQLGGGLPVRAWAKRNSSRSSPDRR